MRFSWNEIKDAVYSLKSYLSSDPHVQRQPIFGSKSKEPDEALPVSSQPQPESQQLQHPPAFHPLVVETASNAAAAAAQATAPSSPLAADEKGESRSIGELAVPAALCVAIYGSIPADVHLHHGGFPLYDPLVFFVSLGVFASLCIVVYALAKPGGGPDVESTKQNVMAVAVGFFLMAFMLRILLLLPITSPGLVGLLFVLGATLVTLFLYLSCLGRKKKATTT